MTTFLTIVAVIVAVVVVLALLAVQAFTRLRRLDLAAQEALGGIDAQLTRRADLAPALLNAVERYAPHERGVFEELSCAQTAVKAAADNHADATVPQKAAAQARLDRAIADVLTVAEAYPDLTASASFLALQQELSDTDERLALARQHYNAAVTALDKTVRTIPGRLLSRPAGVPPRDPYPAPHR